LNFFVFVGSLLLMLLLLLILFLRVAD